MDGEEGFQEKILSDGKVNDSEYRQAIEATQSCLERDGWETSEIRTAMDGVRLEFNVGGLDESGGDDQQQQAELSGSFTACTELYLDEVERSYLDAHVLGGEAQAKEMASLVDCLAGVGVTGVLTSDTQEAVTGKIAGQLVDGELTPGLVCLEQHLYAFPSTVP